MRETFSSLAVSTQLRSFIDKMLPDSESLWSLKLSLSNSVTSSFF